MRIKSILFYLAIIVSLVNGQFTEAQEQQVDEQIRKLDLAAAAAILHKDYQELDRLLAEDFIVNSPGNILLKGRKAVEDLIRTGVINYSTFDRNIESVFINDDTAVVMGSETIKTISQGSDSGETIHRRYTNVWMNIDGKWLLTARHANVICGQ